MLKQYIDRLGFIIENFHLSTNAISIGIIETSGKIAVECGNIDLDAISLIASTLNKSATDLFETVSGYSNKNFTMFMQGVKNDIFVAPVSSGLFLLALFPKSVNIFDIRQDIEKFVAEISKVFIEIKPYIETR